MAKFIVFEGIDGSGKSTQIKRLGEYFKKRGIPHIVTKEPTEGPIGSLAKSVVRGDTSVSEEALSLLFAADRAQHIAKEIRPALESGTYVLCDRYVYSNMAYQGIEAASYNKRFLLVPDLVIFIDADPKECTRRIILNRQSVEIYDGEKIANKIRARYLEIFRRYKGETSVEIIDGNQNEKEVFEQLLQCCMSHAILPSGN